MIEIHVIEWIDSTGYDGWRNREGLEDAKPKNIVTCGMLAKEDDTFVYLKQSDAEWQIGNVIAIPHVTIVKHHYYEIKEFDYINNE